MIEEFFKAHQHTIAAIAAAGTVGAVLTSLWLAWRANRADRTRLSAGADIVLIFHMPIDGKTVPKFLRVSITNHGKWPLSRPGASRSSESAGNTSGPLRRRMRTIEVAPCKG
jgi:hypothetical protein